MIEKIINSFFYGNLKTKLFLWTVLLFALGAIFLLLAGIVLGLPVLGASGIAVGLVGFVISQSVSLNDLQKEKKQKNEKKRKKDSAVGQYASGKGKETEEEQNAKKNTKKEKEKAKAQYLASMDEKKLKKTMKEHKVNQIHVKVMIDSYPEKQIEQAPAFMWRTDTMLHFMVLSDGAYEFEVPLNEITGFLLVKNVPADKERDYASFKISNYITKMFQPYLPEYFESTKDGQLQISKNTFRIEPGIYLTNASVSNLRKVLLPGVAFLVDDQVIASRRFNEYFKELYRESLLCKNMVITLEEYKKEVEKTLDALVVAPIPGSEFVNTLYDLSHYHLITKEYVAVYTQKYRELHLDKK